MSSSDDFEKGVSIETVLTPSLKRLETSTGGVEDDVALGGGLLLNEFKRLGKRRLAANEPFSTPAFLAIFFGGVSESEESDESSLGSESESELELPELFSKSRIVSALLRLLSEVSLFLIASGDPL